ncbi:hypothetical protein UPYG_G00342850 [Umbra pygmaea]|uniref:trypsin n=1 Tax=Umbra pygmaea TaxID=75934 RepID=A0ABD0VWX1_UMBPY
MFVFLILSLFRCGLQHDEHNQTQIVRNLETWAFNRTDEENATLTNGFHDLAGIRSFIPDQEFKVRIIGGVDGSSLLHTVSRGKSQQLSGQCWLKHGTLRTNEDCQQLVGVFKIITHKDYIGKTKMHDIALVKVKTPLAFNQCVRPIEIWRKPLILNKKCTVTGWGSTRENGPQANRLQEVNVTILSPETCDTFYHGAMQTNMFCAGQLEGGVDACQGDSGGPLSCYTGSRYELAGVVSWGVGCGRVQRPGVYTKAQSYLDWIKEIIKGEEIISDAGSVPEESCGRGDMLTCRLDSSPAKVYRTLEGDERVRSVTEACPHSWPWQVSLQSRGRHYCSGTLIHKHWVLVPQHCRCKATVDTVELGLHDLRFMATQTIPVEEVFNHPDNGTYPPTFDITLIKLSVPAQFDTTIFPVCLPDKNMALDDSWSCVTTGWGSSKSSPKVSTATLHQARLELVNSTACKVSWGDDLITDNQLCADSAGSVACMGDSGGPLLCQKTKGIFYLFGLVTWGSPHCDVHTPVIFSRLSAYQSWIKGIVNNS